MKLQKLLAFSSLALSLLSVPIVWTMAQAQTSPSLPVQTLPAEGGESVVQPRSEVGIEFEGFRELNAASLRTTEYVGECPGRAIGRVNGRFVSSQTPPAAGLRVVIRNVTRGMGGDIEPYTDREYDKGRRSEGFFIQPATRHNSKYLAVLAGTNDFEYQIKRGSTVVESGSFAVEVDQQTRTIERDARDVYEEYCAKKNVSLNDCKSKDRRTRLVRKCPGESGYYSVF